MVARSGVTVGAVPAERGAQRRYLVSTVSTQPAIVAGHNLVGAPDIPLLVAVPDAARLLGIGVTLTWELVRSGAIPSVKLGRRVLVSRVALEQLADSQTPDRDSHRYGDGLGPLHCATPISSPNAMSRPSRQLKRRQH